MSEIKKYIKSDCIKLSYKEFLEVAQGLIQDGQFELRKNWLEARTEIKFINQDNFIDLNFVHIRGLFTNKYGILVSKNDFKEVLEFVSESITPKIEEDEWIYIAKEWLTENNLQEISTKELGNKCFNLSIKELNPKLLQRLAKVLRCCNYSQNTKTRKWIKNNEVQCYKTPEPIQDKNSSVALPMLLTATTIDSTTTLNATFNATNELEITNKEIQKLKKLLEQEKQKNIELEQTSKILSSKLLESTVTIKNKDKTIEELNKQLKDNKELNNKSENKEQIAKKVSYSQIISPFEELEEEQKENIDAVTEEINTIYNSTILVPNFFAKPQMIGQKIDMFSGQPINDIEEDIEELVLTGDEDD